MTPKEKAVDWLYNQIKAKLTSEMSENFKDLFRSAQVMFDEQMNDAAMHNVTVDKNFRKIIEDQFNQWYKENYPKNDI
jgi:hypothetical protein